MSASVPSTAVEPQTYRFTFGIYNQTMPWTDRRELTWPDLADLLATHQIGIKRGHCVVPAVFSGTKRHKNDAQCIGVAFLDSDSGATLEEITAAVEARGWTAIVSSTYSHLTTTTVVKRIHWDKYRGADTTADQALAPAAFLEKEKGYLPRVAAGARIVQEDETYVTFEHQPCPKFRVAIPLLHPWLAANYINQQQANAGWKERIEALAAALDLNHDQPCTDTSRLFYLPRRAADAPPAETKVLAGVPCDLFTLPAVSTAKSAKLASREASRTRPQGDGVLASEFTFKDADTGEVIDLGAWARANASRFEIVAALQARRPETFVGKVADGTKHHICCANEEQHTDAGPDVATIVINASESTSKGFVYHCRHAHCDGIDRLVFLRQMLEQGWLKVSDLTDTRFLIGGKPARREIRYVAAELPTIVDQAEQALLQAELGLYQRGSLIVRPGLAMLRVSNGQNVTAQRVFEVEAYAMVEAMTLAAAWTKYDARSECWVDCYAPPVVAATYRQRIGHWRLLVLSGLINAPSLRPDGSILDTPGYDRVTGLLLDTQGVAFPIILECPTRSQAISALADLEALIDTFPFVDQPSRSVALSAILTACLRRSLRTAPLHGFTAPMAGSGKSMLVDLTSLIATGREAGVIAQGKTEEEFEKRLGALLLAGDQVIAVDNCEAPLSSEFLCSMLTQQVVRPRILGRSEAPELPADAFVTATGNNLVLVGDLTRRAMLCRLDPKHERPELRQFDADPLEAVKADRGRYLVAALTVLRAYHVAGRPDPPPKLGSFEAWSGWVRGALIWLDQADPVDTMAEARELDPRLNALVNVLTQWHAVLGGNAVSVRELIEQAMRQCVAPAADPSAASRLEFAHPDFRDVLLAVAGEDGLVNSRRLGKWLAAHQGRVVQGRRIVRQGLSAGVMHWRLEMTGGGPPDATG